jgi:DNA polymerase III alpha subunit
VSTSAAQFTVAGDQILFGLAGIKGVGQGAVEAIIEARRERPFDDLFDFCQRTASGRVNKKVVESLVKCGALDGCGGAPRERLLAALEEAMASGAKSRQDKRKGPANTLLTAVEPPPKRERIWPEAEPLTEAARLELEKELLGFYVSGHPLDRYNAAMAAIRTCSLSEARLLADKTQAKLCGVITRLLRKVGKNDNPYAFATLEDASGSAEFIIWSSTLSKRSDVLEVGRLVTINGKVDNRGPDEKYGLKIICEDVLDFERSLDNGLGSMTINVALSELEPVAGLLAERARLRGVRKFSPRSSRAARPDPAQVAVFLVIADGLGRAVYRLDDKIRLSVDLFEELSRSLPLAGAGAVACSSSQNPFLGA